MDKLVLIGRGGNCHSCIDVIESSTQFSFSGILDLPHLKGTSILGFPVIGNDVFLGNCVTIINKEQICNQMIFAASTLVNKSLGVIGACAGNLYRKIK